MVLDLLEVLDVVFVGVNCYFMVDIVEKLVCQNVGGVVCFVFGFKEVVGELKDSYIFQDVFVEVVGLMLIFGLNCYGFLNVLDWVVLWFD